MEDFFMKTTITVLLIILAVFIALMVVLYILGKKAERKKAQQDAQVAAAAQTATMLVIDKKRMRLKESGLPQAVMDSTPRMMRLMKVPVVKAKIGPRIVTLIADESVYDLIPIKKEVKATISGIYISKVTGIRGPLEKPTAKKGFKARLHEKLVKANAKAAEANKAAAKSTGKTKTAGKPKTLGNAQSLGKEKK